MPKRSGRPDSRIRQAVIAMHTNCWLCGEPVDKTLRWPHPKSPSLDHVIPISQGGPTTIANGRLACLGCNSSRRDKPIDPVTSQHW